jgi:hypothetical protein
MFRGAAGMYSSALLCSIRVGVGGGLPWLDTNLNHVVSESYHYKQMTEKNISQYPTELLERAKFN